MNAFLETTSVTQFNRQELQAERKQLRKDIKAMKARLEEVVQELASREYNIWPGDFVEDGGGRLGYFVKWKTGEDAITRAEGRQPSLVDSSPTNKQMVLTLPLTVVRMGGM